MSEELNQFNFTKEIRYCPKCKNTQFHEHDCGPDSWDDDITYSSFSCSKCGLWFDGWSKEWYENVDSWTQIEGREPFTSQEASKK